MNLQQALAKCPPPERLRLVGKVDWAHFCPKPDFIKPHRHTGARAQGVRYEKKVHEYLLGRFPYAYLPAPWLNFYTLGSPRWCQPDGMLIRPIEGRITVVEVKYQHTSDAWWQLVHIYRPVLEAIFPPGEWEYNYLEVVKWYDPSVLFPCTHRLTPDPLDLKQNEFGVHIWTP